jgi:hypothetical protein
MYKIKFCETGIRHRIHITSFSSLLVNGSNKLESCIKQGRSLLAVIATLAYFTTVLNTTRKNCIIHGAVPQHNDNRHNGTQHNDTQHNYTQPNDTHHNDTLHNDTQHNDTQHNDTQHNDTHYNDT